MKKILLVIQGAAMPKHKPSGVQGQLFLSFILLFSFSGRDTFWQQKEVQVYSIIIKFSNVCILSDQVLQAKKNNPKTQTPTNPPKNTHINTYSLYKNEEFLLRYRNSKKPL